MKLFLRIFLLLVMSSSVRCVAMFYDNASLLAQVFTYVDRGYISKIPRYISNHDIRMNKKTTQALINYAEKKR
ncbi:hypothetical protein HRU45_02550 [Candidatus Dependentiae bacterium]|nr:hypothetical protein [Candidatus Dependentiae bacterium]